MNNNIWTMVFVMAGALLATAVTTMVPAAYAADNSAEDDSLSQQNNCDENDISGSTPNFNDVCENSVSGFTAND